MKYSSLQITAMKLAIFGTVLLYLAVDLFLLHGPAWRVLHKRDNTAVSTDTRAIVYGEAITAEQYDRFAEEQNWLRGRSSAPEAERIPMLMELVHDTLLRLRARYNDMNLPDTRAAAEKEVQRLATRAPSDEAFDAWLACQGYTRQTYTQELTARLKDMHLLKRVIEPHCRVGDEDAARHYEHIKSTLTQPASRPLRHIFLATLGKDEEEVHRRAEELLHQLENGADFAELAREHSEAPHTAAQGGDVGTVQDAEGFPLRELPLFGENAIPAQQYALARSRWGWHILLPGEITPARVPSFEECKESLKTAILSAQAEIAIRAFRDATLKEAFAKKHLRIIHAD